MPAGIVNGVLDAALVKRETSVGMIPCVQEPSHIVWIMAAAPLLWAQNAITRLPQNVVLLLPIVLWVAMCVLLLCLGYTVVQMQTVLPTLLIVIMVFV